MQTSRLQTDFAVHEARDGFASYRSELYQWFQFIEQVNKIVEKLYRLKVFTHT